MTQADPRIDALKRAIALVGSQSATGRLLGVTQAAVWGWLDRGVPLPAEHVLAVEAATGVSRHELRPDIYPDQRDDPTPAGRLDRAAGALDVTR